METVPSLQVPQAEPQEPQTLAAVASESPSTVGTTQPTPESAPGDENLVLESGELSEEEINIFVDSSERFAIASSGSSMEDISEVARQVERPVKPVEQVREEVTVQEVAETAEARMVEQVVEPEKPVEVGEASTKRATFEQADTTQEEGEEEEEEEAEPEVAIETGTMGTVAGEAEMPGAAAEEGTYMYICMTLYMYTIMQ